MIIKEFHENDIKDIAHYIFEDMHVHDPQFLQKRFHNLFIRWHIDRINLIREFNFTEWNHNTISLHLTNVNGYKQSVLINRDIETTVTIIDLTNQTML